MANTSALYARIDSDLKENAEAILSRLGISPNGAIQMFYTQIVLRRGIPFEINLPAEKPFSMGNASKEEIVQQLRKGLEEIESGNILSAEQMKEELKKESGI